MYWFGQLLGIIIASSSRQGYCLAGCLKGSNQGQGVLVRQQLQEWDSNAAAGQRFLGEAAAG